MVGIRDRRLVAEYYPSLRFYLDRREQLVTLEGNIVIVADCGVRTPITTLIKFPWSYWEIEPRAYDAQRRFQALPGRHINDRHLTGNGRCCLWLPPRSRWNGNDPNSLRDFLDELSVFFERQLIYDVTGAWPGLEYSHREAGYVEELAEEPDGVADLLVPVIRRETHVDPYGPCPCVTRQEI